jgi:hypothetical protein
MHVIRLLAPERRGETVLFRWTVTPETELYRKTEFSLTFPRSIPLDRVPAALWWRVTLICLHAHWTLLRPCRVELPVGLPPGEVEFWRRLLDVEVQTLETYRRAQAFDCDVEIVCSGEPLPAIPPLADSGRCATAFSGGKDSLLQVGLLCKLTENPLLVATTSPMPPLYDHVTPRRKKVFREIAARKPVTLVEVKSDLRESWDNLFSQRLGSPISVNEIGDTLLYFAALLAVAYACGVPHLFLASEAEVQENAEVEGRLVMHLHFIYGAVVQRALAALLAPAGISYSSLTWALPSVHVQETLWQRYGDISDLQYSCWQVGAEEETCSRCSQCLRLAVGVLKMGKNPEAMGIDLRTLFPAMREWAPGGASIDPNVPAPRRITSLNLNQQVIRNLQQTSPRQVERVLYGHQPWRRFGKKTRAALEAFHHLQATYANAEVPPSPGYRDAFVDLVDARLREPLRRIFAESIPAEPPEHYAGVLERSLRATAWITEPLRAVAS